MTHFDLQSISDDAGIRQQPAPVARTVGGHPIDIEAIEGGHEGPRFFKTVSQDRPA
jgi:hypothetical protein